MISGNLLFGSPYLSKAQQPQEQRYTHSYQCVQYFRESKGQCYMYGCHCLGLLTCEQTLMYAIAHGGLQGRREIKSLHWKLTAGEKSLAARGN